MVFAELRSYPLRIWANDNDITNISYFCESSITEYINVSFDMYLIKNNIETVFICIDMDNDKKCGSIDDSELKLKIVKLIKKNVDGEILYTKHFGIKLYTPILEKVSRILEKYIEDNTGEGD